MIYTFDQAVKKAGIKPTDVKSVSIPEATPAKSGFGQTLKEAGSDIFQTYKKVGEQLYGGGEKILETATNKELNLGEKVIQGTSQAFRSGSRAFGEGVLGIGKTLIGQETEEKIAEKTQEALKPIAESEVIKNLVSRYKSLDPETKRNIDNALGFAEGLADIYTAGTVSRVAKPLIKGTLEAVESGIDTGLKKVKSLFPENAVFKNTDEVINQADSSLKQDLPPLKPNATPSEIRIRAELESPNLSFKEKWAGITPDVKKVIQGKPKQMQEYLDVVNTRNLDVNSPSAFEYGGNRARQATEKMESIIKDTGGEIGSFRQKVGTYKANFDQVKSIEVSFSNELSKLNLEVKNGQISQIAGKPRKVAGKGDVSAINELYSQIKVLKQDPNLTNLIDIRNLFSQNIDFGKRIGDVSDSLDSLSKSVRANIKDVSAKIVGKSEAQKLVDYSDFMEALGDIRSYTDRNAGGEYLLRVLLSGRGGEARKIISTINKYTGIDLTDDAVMATLVTDMLGNQRQKNLFAQEITKAGLDVTRILSGDPSTVIERVVQFAKDRYLDSEKVLKEASR